MSTHVRWRSAWRRTEWTSPPAAARAAPQARASCSWVPTAASPASSWPARTQPGPRALRRLRGTYEQPERCYSSARSLSVLMHWWLRRPLQPRCPCSRMSVARTGPLQTNSWPKSPSSRPTSQSSGASPGCLWAPRRNCWRRRAPCRRAARGTSSSPGARPGLCSLPRTGVSSASPQPPSPAARRWTRRGRATASARRLPWPLWKVGLWRTASASRRQRAPWPFHVLGRCPVCHRARSAGTCCSPAAEGWHWKRPWRTAGQAKPWGTAPAWADRLMLLQASQEPSR
mmetsp:Transcript_8378/g.25390  ORF Transcript_8378/g.25390 Transcript_8378/m.25390 type:complete len:286 (-) Transcript_8378:1115-1972(-)